MKLRRITMFKKLIIFSAITVMYITLSQPVVSATTDASSSATIPPTPNSLQDKIDKIKILKDKIATTVAQIRKNEKKALYGKITALGKDSIDIITREGVSVTLNTTSDTGYFSLDNARAKSDSSLDKMKKDSPVTAFGYYDVSSKSMDTRIVYLTPTIPHYLTGKILDIDRTNYTISLKTFSDDTWTIDIETYTKTQIYKDSSIQKSGFSKLYPGEIIDVVSIDSPKEKNRASASRILAIYDVSQPAVSLSPSPKLKQ